MALKTAELKLWIYDGDLGNYDANNPNYTITKTKLSTEETILFEIAELAKDYITVSFDGNYGAAKFTSWVSYELTSTFDTQSGDEDQTSVQTGTLLGTHAYGYFEDEINPQLTTSLQQSNTCIYWRKGEKVRVPLYSNQSLYDIEWYEGETVKESVTFGTQLEKITADTVDFTADHQDKIQLTADTTHKGSLSKGDYTKDTFAPINSTKGVITARDDSKIEVYINYIDECKNTPYKVTFLNKFGVLQDIWFFGRRKEKADVSRESFRVNTINSTSTSTFYPTYKRTDKIHNVESKKALTLNTGFICEDYNEVIQQLLQTEFCWIHEDNKVFPVTPSENNIEYKTNLYEKLLNFTLNFDYAYSELNSVR